MGLAMGLWGLLLVILGVMAMAWMSRRQQAKALELLKAQFPELSRHALRDMGEDFLRLAKRELAVERERGLGDLDSKRQAVDSAIKGLEDQLRRYEALVKGFESDRDRKYGKLEGELKRVVQEADQLQRTTASLVAVLGNSRVRGQWGQKMADDILHFCGLQEGIQYQREKEIGAGRPDYTFLLPADHYLFMDVKFPLEHYLRFSEASHEEDQRRHREAFIKDVREHLREMERRDYTAQSDRAVDYLLLFIPNEQVYGLINEWMPQLIDECLRKKIILCGPWTLYAMVRIIWQAWQNYHYTVAIQDIVRAIDGFRQDYAKFKERFEDLGALLEKGREKYQEITAKSYQRLETRLNRIKDYHAGRQSSAGLSEPEPIALTPLPSLGERHDG
ncbi:MAG: DNA recombination protein RmuC [Candidatus Omnitrophica bacterium]|nr:DNA recombination protein RmuC [Candidatus Omnitrophota bacterium]